MVMDTWRDRERDQDLAQAPVQHGGQEPAREGGTEPLSSARAPQWSVASGSPAQEGGTEPVLSARAPWWNVTSGSAALSAVARHTLGLPMCLPLPRAWSTLDAMGDCKRGDCKEIAGRLQRRLC
ncbi:hypothetical protein B0H34DRAFT_722159, partial [Crassisporium funariophilum]